MQVTYANNTQRGPGNGLFICTDETFSDAPQEISLQRSSDRMFLGTSGEWNVQQVWLPVDSHTLANGELTLFVGPSIVNELDPLVNYRLSVRADNEGPFKAGLSVQDVIYSLRQTVDNADTVPFDGDRPKPAQTAQPAPVQPEPQPAQQPETPPAPEPVPAQPAPEPAPAPQPAPAPEAAPAPQPAPAEPAQPAPTPDAAAGSAPLASSGPSSQKSKLPLLIAAIVLLLAAIGAWFFFMQKGASNPAPESAPVTTPPPAPAAVSVEDRVKGFFAQSDRAPDGAARLSRELTAATPAEQDAIYRLYYFASENGDPSMLVEYAACVDPAKPQWGTISKDAPAAWAIYDRAKAANPAAAAAQQALKEWLVREAGAGNRQASDWLNQLPKE